jgi:hypothetical protein
MVLVQQKTVHVEQQKYSAALNAIRQKRSHLQMSNLMNNLFQI